MQIWQSIKRHVVPHTDNAYRPTLMRRPWLLFFLGIILATEGFLVADLVARQSDQTFLAAVVPAEIVALTNNERQQNDVGTLTENPQLTQAAQAKADDMAAQDYFSHTGPDGKTPWQWITQFGYQYQYAGENLAVQFIDSSNVVNAWMASPTHQANIVKPVYTDTGVGVAQGLYEGQEATYVVQYFAAPATQPAALAAAAQTSSFMQSLIRQTMRALADPQATANWILGLVATVLVLLLCMTFFVHVQIQHHTTLAGGALVLGLAVSFLALNLHLSEGGSVSSQTQTASVIQAPQGGATVIDPQAAAVGYALFPSL